MRRANSVSVSMMARLMLNIVQMSEEGRDGANLGLTHLDLDACDSPVVFRAGAGRGFAESGGGVGYGSGAGYGSGTQDGHLESGEAGPSHRLLDSEAETRNLRRRE